MKNELNSGSLKLIGNKNLKFPLSQREALKYGGVGPSEIKKLIKLGYVYDESFEGLSARARNVIHRLGLKTKSEALEAIRSGQLKAKGYNINLIEMEILNWAGFKKVQHTCQECGSTKTDLVPL